MPGRVVGKDRLVTGLALCGIGLERLLSAHIVGPLAADLWIRLGTGLSCTGIGLGLIVTWLWRGGASGWLGQARR